MLWFCPLLFMCTLVPYVHVHVHVETVFSYYCVHPWIPPIGRTQVHTCYCAPSHTQSHTATCPVPLSGCVHAPPVAACAVPSSRPTRSLPCAPTRVRRSPCGRDMHACAYTCTCTCTTKGCVFGCVQNRARGACLAYAYGRLTLSLAAPNGESSTLFFTAEVVSSTARVTWL